MPSGLTHILLVKESQNKIKNEKLRNILAYASDSFQIGAVGPDLPYASVADRDLFLTNENALADNFHYVKTNQIALKSLNKIKELKGKIDEEIHYHLFSFFLGYISHIMADGIMHPFVRDMVGEYAENKSEHRSLEMQIDVLFMEELTKNSGHSLELNYTNIHNELTNFETVEGVDTILELFSNLIEEVYGKRYNTQKILGWVKGLHRLLEIAEGELPKFYRNLKINTFTYKNRQDIDREKVFLLKKPKDRDLNFLHKDRIHFLEDCVPLFYEKFLEISEKAYLYVFEEGKELTEKDIPAINLDTGRMINKNDLNLIPEFWKK